MLDRKRKVALLQASALIFSQLWEHRESESMNEEDLIQSAVTIARSLLAEIDKQEAEPLS